MGLLKLSVGPINLISFPPITQPVLIAVTCPGKSLPMNFPALIPSNSLHFLEKTKPHFQIRRSRTPLWSTTHNVGAYAQASSETSGKRSVSKKCTDRENENRGPLRLENGGKGWIHFVGVGGCGLSALAMLALKQVSSFRKR
jgi:hypothetical protein